MCVQQLVTIQWKLHYWCCEGERRKDSCWGNPQKEVRGGEFSAQVERVVLDRSLNSSSRS